jgi:hypothetical protein
VVDVKQLHIHLGKYQMLGIQVNKKRLIQIEPKSMQKKKVQITLNRN